MRFGERLQVKIDVSPELDAARVPALVLQPLVENAVRHAGRTTAGVRIRVLAGASDGQLRLEVRDDGEGPPETWSLQNSSGVGLRNTAERLAQMFGDNASLTFARPAGGGFAVIVRLPLRQPAPA